jgi:hypothetical protein
LVGRLHFFRVLRLVLFDKRRWANILFAALLADDVDQVGTRQTQIAVVTQLHELLQMYASHGQSSAAEWSLLELYRSDR